jgi:biotin carboxylase
VSGAANAGAGPSRILVIGARDSSFAGSENRGFAIDLLQSPERLTRFQEEQADRVVVVDLDDTAEVAAAAVKLHDDRPVVGVVAFHEHLLDIAVAVAEVLEVRGTCGRAVANVRDKGITRGLAEGSGIINPRHVVPGSRRDWPAAVAKVGWPAIVKPLTGAGSEGVRLARTLVELEAAADDRCGGNKRWIIEEYLEGPELSVETFTGRNGTVVRAITETVTDPETFVEVGHQTPARVSPELAERIETGVRRMMANVGLNVGPGHTEIKVVDGNPHLIETHVRYGGGRIWQMTGLTTGFYPQAEMLADLAGDDLSPAAPAGPAAAIRFLTCPPGIVTQIDGRSRAENTAGVIEVNIGVRRGDRVHPLRSSDDRVGYVMTIGDSMAAAEAAADRAHGEIRVTTAAAG